MTAVTIPASVKTIGASAFEGCGQLADVYFEGDAVSSVGVDAFRGCCWDLIMHVPETWQGRGRTLCGYTVWKGDEPNEVVRVVSTNVVVHYLTTNVPVAVVAPISPDTGIVNVMTEVKGGNVAIPDSWAKNFPTFEEKFGSDFTAALTKPTGKRGCDGGEMQVWQDYVAGTDPTDVTKTFKATITMVGDVPDVQWDPVLVPSEAEKRTYRKFGKVRLQDEWGEITAGKEADYNFFKVTVEMK